MKYIAILLVTLLLTETQCSRILTIFPFPARSLYILGSSLARGLAEAGHDVTMVSPFAEKDPPKNGTYRDIVLTGVLDDSKKMNINMFQMENLSPYLVVLFIGTMAAEITRKTFEHPNFQELINSNEKFDAVIVENSNNDALNGLAHHFNAPLILFTSIGPNTWINPLVGNPSPKSYVPEALVKYTSDMTFFERVDNWLLYVLQRIHRYGFYYSSQNRLMKEFLPHVPDLADISYNTSIALLNNHESINQAVPHVPNMIDIGGFHVKPPKKLPKDLQKFLDNAKEGVVYFSMGSNIKPSDMPEEKRQAILKALGKIKQKVLWKWDEDTLPGKPDNVKLSKWFPQQDILAHPNTKLFITHGGLLSATETIYHGVPVLSFPIFGDQKMNAARSEINGFGLTLTFSEITEEKLSSALEKLLNDPKYRENAKRRSRLLHDRPIKPMDLAVYWVEFVIRHRGAPHLRVAGVDLPWYKLLLLDVITFVILVSVSVSAILFVVVRKLCCRNNKPKVKLN